MATAQGTSGAAWASTTADAKLRRSSSAAPWGSIGRRRTLPGTSRPTRRSTRAEVTCLPPISMPRRAQETRLWCDHSPHVRLHNSDRLRAPGLHHVGADRGRDNGRLGVGQSYRGTSTGDGDGDAGTFDHVEDVEPTRGVFRGLRAGTQLETPNFKEDLRELTKDLLVPAHARPYLPRRRDQVGRNPAALTLAVEVLESEVGTDCSLPALAVSAQPVVKPQGVEVRGGAHLQNDVADAAAVRCPRWNEIELVRDGGEDLDVPSDVERAARSFGLLSVSLEDVDVRIFPQP